MLFLNGKLNISISTWRDMPKEEDRIIAQSVDGSRLRLFWGHDPDPQRWIILTGYFWLLLDTCTRQSARLYWLNNRRQPKHEWATDKNTGLRCSEDPKALVLISRRSVSVMNIWITTQRTIFLLRDALSKLNSENRWLCLRCFSWNFFGE